VDGDAIECGLYNSRKSLLDSHPLVIIMDLFTWPRKENGVKVVVTHFQFHKVKKFNAMFRIRIQSHLKLAF